MECGMKAFSTRGGCVPVVPDAGHLLVHTCRRPVGGEKTIQAPQFILTVTNGEGGIEDLFEDENGVVVVDDALESLILNQ
jgi:hypothetical protein